MAAAIEIPPVQRYVTSAHDLAQRYENEPNLFRLAETLETLGARLYHTPTTYDTDTRYWRMLNSTFQILDIEATFFQKQQQRVLWEMYYNKEHDEPVLGLSAYRIRSSEPSYTRRIGDSLEPVHRFQLLPRGWALPGGEARVNLTVDWHNIIVEF